MKDEAKFQVLDTTGLLSPAFLQHNYAVIYWATELLSFSPIFWRLSEGN